MLRVLAIVAATSLFGAVAMADCAENCNNGFDVCMKNCGGQAGCLETCSRGRSGCLKRCEQSQNSPRLPWRTTELRNRSRHSCADTRSFTTSRNYDCTGLNISY